MVLGVNNKVCVLTAEQEVYGRSSGGGSYIGFPDGRRGGMEEGDGTKEQQ